MRLGVRLGLRDGIEAAALQVMHGVEHRGVDVVAQLPVVGLLHLLRVEVRLGLRLGVRARVRARANGRTMRRPQCSSASKGQLSASWLRWKAAAKLVYALVASLKEVRTWGGPWVGGGRWAVGRGQGAGAEGSGQLVVGNTSSGGARLGLQHA